MVGIYDRYAFRAGLAKQGGGDEKYGQMNLIIRAPVIPGSANCAMIDVGPAYPETGSTGGHLIRLTGILAGDSKMRIVVEPNTTGLPNHLILCGLVDRVPSMLNTDNWGDFILDTNIDFIGFVISASTFGNENWHIVSKNGALITGPTESATSTNLSRNVLEMEYDFSTTTMKFFFSSNLAVRSQIGSINTNIPNGEMQMMIALYSGLASTGGQGMLVDAWELLAQRIFT